MIDTRHLCCLLLVAGLCAAMPESALAALDKEPPEDPALCVRWHVEWGREWFKAGRFDTAAEHFVAARDAIENGDIDGDPGSNRLQAECLRMLAHTYYPHLKETHAQQAVAAAEAYHRWIESRQISPKQQDRYLYDNAVHLAKVYLSGGPEYFEEAKKLLSETSLSPTVDSRRPARALELLILQSRIAALQQPKRATDRPWDAVASRIARIDPDFAHARITAGQAAGFFSVLQELPEHSPPEEVIVTAKWTLYRLCVMLEQSPKGEQVAPRGWMALGRVCATEKDYSRAWSYLHRATTRLQRTRPAGRLTVQCLNDLGRVAVAQSRATHRSEEALDRLEQSTTLLVPTIKLLEEYARFQESTALRSTLALIYAEQSRVDDTIKQLKKRVAYHEDKTSLGGDPRKKPYQLAGL
ncbi:MAG: hypothetical protein V3R99_00960 [Thermoguttaceae bacterium]